MPGSYSDRRPTSAASGVAFVDFGSSGTPSARTFRQKFVIFGLDNVDSAILE